MTEKLEWSTFAIPYSHLKHYILLMIFALWFLPGVFGLRFTLMGYALNYFWADFMFYIWYKNKILTQEYWKQERRKKDWRDDNDKGDHME